jgi:hypothetical protein
MDHVVQLGLKMKQLFLAARLTQRALNMSDATK